MADRTGPGSWIEFGIIARAHGVRGELRLVPLDKDSDLPEAVTRLRLTPRGGEPRVVVIASVRPVHRAMLVTLEGIADRDAAQALSGCRVEIEASTLPELEPGEIYLHELVGAEAHDGAGRRVGVVTGLYDNRGQDVLVLDFDGQERLLPLADETLVRFDRTARRVELVVPAGLWD